jgi:hypothetical protein
MHRGIKDFEAEGVVYLVMNELGLMMKKQQFIAETISRIGYTMSTLLTPRSKKCSEPPKQS